MTMQHLFEPAFDMPETFAHRSTAQKAGYLSKPLLEQAIVITVVFKISSACHVQRQAESDLYSTIAKHDCCQAVTLREGSRCSSSCEQGRVPSPGMKDSIDIDQLISSSTSRIPLIMINLFSVLELFASWDAVQSGALHVVHLSKPAQPLSDAATAVLACFMLKPHAMKHA